MKKYKSFESVEIAQLLTELLDESNTYYELHNSEGKIEDFDSSQPQGIIEVWIAEDQFDYIDDLIEEKVNSELDTVADDYFIFEFSNDELRNVLINAHEWSPIDLALANKLLKERGEPFEKEELHKIREEKIAESALSRDISKGRKVTGLIVALLFPLIGIITALIYLLATKEDLSGKKVPKYGEPTKKHGKIVITIALFGTVLLIAKIYFS